MTPRFLFKKIINNIIKNNKKKVVPYSIYLKTELKRDKNKRIKAIKEWYDHINK